MADAILSVSLEAQVANFRQNLRTAAQEMNRTSQATETAVSAISSNIARVNTINLGGFNRSLAAGQISLSRLNTSAANTATSLRPLTTGTNSAAFALTNLGRVAQDAPFGFIGIQNNLNPLLESFGRLRQETGSNGAALRALGQSLVGPAGLGIALSVVSAAVLFYQQYQQRANKTVKEAKTDADAYVNSLDQVTQAQVKGSKNAQKEITELNTLYAITQNVALSTKQRGDAVDTLQSKYPEYFKNLSDEAILNGNAESAYKRLAVAIIETAKARAAQDLITKNSSRQLENQQKLNDLEIAFGKEQQKNAVALNKIRDPNNAGSAQFLARQAENAVKAQAAIAKQITDLKTDSNIIDSKNLKLTEAITASIKQGAELTDTGNGKAKKEINDIAKEVKDLYVLIDNGSKGVSRALIRNTLKNTPVGDPKLEGNGFNIPGLENTSRVKEYNQLLAEQAKFKADYEEGFKSLASGAIGDAIGGGFSSIGEALVSGESIIEAAGNALLGTLGGFLNDLGQMLIKKGLATVLAGTALNFLFPGSGAKTTAGGFGLIAAGAALSLGSGIIGAGRTSPGSNKSTNNVTAFANGGIVSGPTNALIGEYAGARNNPEVVAPLSKLKSMIGGGDQIFIAESVIRGQDIVTTYRKASGTLRRVN